MIDQSETIGKDPAKITIGLCMKNSEKTIKNCMESIINQDYPKELAELILVDGGSKDRTIEIAKEMISKVGISSRLFFDNGKGLGFARQMVLDSTDRKYVVWVDSDVAISKDFVTNQVTFMAESPDVAVATGKSVFQANIAYTLPALLQGLSKYVGSVEFKQTKNYRGLPPNDASIYRVEAARQVGGFDKKIKGASEDEDLFLRMREKGWSLRVNTKAEFYAVPKDTWQSLWTEVSWFGYGTHYLNHKREDSRALVRKIPIISFIGGLKVGLKAYRLTLRKESLLMPFSYVFASVAWWFGYIRAHEEGYGHEEFSAKCS